MNTDNVFVVGINIGFSNWIIITDDYYMGLSENSVPQDYILCIKITIWVYTSFPDTPICYYIYIYTYIHVYIYILLSQYCLTVKVCNWWTNSFVCNGGPLMSAMGIKSLWEVNTCWPEWYPGAKLWEPTENHLCWTRTVVLESYPTLDVSTM